MYVLLNHEEWERSKLNQSKIKTLYHSVNNLLALAMRLLISLKIAEFTVSEQCVSAKAYLHIPFSLQFFNNLNWVLFLASMLYSFLGSFLRHLCWGWRQLVNTIVKMIGVSWEFSIVILMTWICQDTASLQRIWWHYCMTALESLWLKRGIISFGCRPNCFHFSSGKLNSSRCYWWKKRLAFIQMSITNT